MSFINVMDFSLYNQKNTSNPPKPLGLRVSQEKGVEVIPDMNINVTPLNRAKNNTLYNFFINGGYGGITFKIEVIIKKGDTWYPGVSKYGGKVIDVLNTWVQNGRILYVTSQAMDIPNGRYVITANPTRKQTFKNHTAWELEFTTYNPLNIAKYKNNNSAVLNAIAKAKKANAKKASTSNSKLKKCDYKVLKYSKKKKVVKCVKYMQQILYKRGFLKKKQVDGWFGKKTKAAVKKFQKDYNKKHKITINVKSGDKLKTGKKYLSKSIPTNGKVDKATFKAICAA